MPQGQVRSELERFRDRLVEQRDALTKAIDAIDVAIPLFPNWDGGSQSAAPPTPTPPRSPAPGPQATSEAGPHEQVLRALKGGCQGPTEIREKTGLSEYLVNNRLKALVSAGLVVKKGTGPRNTTYHVTTQATLRPLRTSGPQDLDHDDDEPFELPEPEYKHPVKVGKPPLRRPTAKNVVTGELPWWAKANRGEMTKAAAEQQERMQKSKEAKQLGGKLNFV